MGSSTSSSFSFDAMPIDTSLQQVPTALMRMTSSRSILHKQVSQPTLDLHSSPTFIHAEPPADPDPRAGQPILPLGVLTP